MSGSHKSDRPWLAILADVHGNWPALEAVLADMKRLGAPDGIVVAGDHAVGTPYPAEVVDRLRTLDAVLIAGNRDGYIRRILRGQAPGWETGEGNGSVRWGYLSLGPERAEYLASLPEQATIRLDTGEERLGPAPAKRDVSPIRVIHGSLRSLSGRILPDRDEHVIERFRQVHVLEAPDELPAEAALEAIDEPVLVCGHTHLQWQELHGDRLALNPGSVGESLDGNPRARYAVLAWNGYRWEAELRDVAYDVGAVKRAFHERGLLPEGGGFARASLRNVETGRNFSGYYVRSVEELARREGLAKGQPIPDEIWQAAAAAFDWEDGAL